MDRWTSSLIALTSFTLAGSAFAQTPAPVGTPEKEASRKPADLNAANMPELENVRKAIEALTPEQRQRFTENFLRWNNLSPDEKKRLQNSAETRRKRMADEIEQAIAKSGLTLDPAQREAFARRYGQERRKIEEGLRRELEEKRQPLVREMIERLKAEFSHVPATATPAVPQ